MPARPAGGRQERERTKRARDGRGTRRDGQRPGAGGAGGRGSRAGSGTGSAAPTPRPAALPPALTAPEPTSAGRTAPNREVRGANHRAPRRGETRLATRPGVDPIAPTPNYTPGNKVQSQNRGNVLSLSSESRHGKLGPAVTSPFPPAPVISYGSVHNWASSIRSEFRGWQLGPGPNHSSYRLPCSLFGIGQCFHDWPEAILEVGNTNNFKGGIRNSREVALEICITRGLFFLRVSQHPHVVNSVIFFLWGLPCAF